MVGLKAAQAAGVCSAAGHSWAFITTKRTSTRPGSRASRRWRISPRLQPNVSLIVSGGHTLLVHVRAELEHRVLGSTVDDAAGECFDKTGKLMGLPYPAGPEIDRLAEGGNPKAFDFPRPMLDEPERRLQLQRPEDVRALFPARPSQPAG